jgi:hypothetical protein
MKKTIFLTMIILFVSISLTFAGGNEKEKMEKWAGVSRIDSFVGAKVVFDPKSNTTSYHGNIIVYPWAWVLKVIIGKTPVVTVSESSVK